MTEEFRCGFVTLAGPPNVGKSTLLNRMLGEKIAITSPRPQTTRNRIPGVLTRDGSQLIFIDTPGLHRARRALNRYMVEVAREAVWETDVVALLAEAGLGPEGEVGIAQVTQMLLDDLRDKGKSVVLVLNKIDQLNHAQLLPVLDAWQKIFSFTDIVPISALSGDGVDRLIEVFTKLLPIGPPLYPADALTDLPERFIAAEIVREKLFRRLGQELPYSTAVTIEAWRDRSRDGLIEIRACIHVERDSQKGIVIGKGGSMVKAIGIEARKDLEGLLGCQVHLSLFVKVDPQWTRSVNSMRKLGYGAP